MKLDEVRKHVKKGPAPTLQIYVFRRIGLYLTWAMINAFPWIQPNTVTFVMFCFGMASSVTFYLSITQHSYIYLIFAALLFNFAECLDCTDGNIARLKDKKSIKGVIYDRIVHNIVGPTIIISIGLAIFAVNQSLVLLVIFIIGGIMTELSPFDMALKDVEALFIGQMIVGDTLVYDISSHSSLKEEKKGLRKENHKHRMRWMITKLTRVLSINNLFCIGLLLDLAFHLRYFHFTLLLTIVIILYRFKTLLKINGLSQELYNRIKTFRNGD